MPEYSCLSCLRLLPALGCIGFQRESAEKLWHLQPADVRSADHTNKRDEDLSRRHQSVSDRTHSVCPMAKCALLNAPAPTPGLRIDVEPSEVFLEADITL